MVKQRQTLAINKAIDDFVTETDLKERIKINLMAEAVLEKNYCQIREEESVELEGNYAGFRTETSSSGEKSLRLKMNDSAGNFYEVDERFIDLIEVFCTGKKYKI